MARVRIRIGEDLEWKTSGIRSGMTAARAILPDGGPASAYPIRERGSDTQPQLVELRFCPHELVELHCHDEPRKRVETIRSHSRSSGR